MAGNLTDTKLRSLKATGKQYQVADGDGLALMVRAGGEMVWQYEYRLHGKKEKVIFGVYPALSLKQARQQHLEARQLVAQGLSAATAKQTAKRQVREAGTVAELAQQYRADYLPLHWKDPDKEYRIIERDFLPLFGSRRLDSVTVEEMLTLIDRKKATSGQASARHLRGAVVRLFDYAILRQVATFNPAKVIPAKMAGAPSVRDRYLKESELRAALRGVYAGSIYRQYKLAFHLLLLTMCRKMEVLGARQDEFELDRGEWQIPADRMKGTKAHTVYLSRQAVAIVRELFYLAGDSDWLLPSHRKAGVHIGDTTLNQAIRRCGLEVDHFTVHDLRRTCDTLLHEMGFEPDTIERSMAHVIGGIRGVYNHAQYIDRRKLMLQHWADYLDSLLGEGNVVYGRFSRPAVGA